VKPVAELIHENGFNIFSATMSRTLWGNFIQPIKRSYLKLSPERITHCISENRKNKKYLVEYSSFALLIVYSLLQAGYIPGVSASRSTCLTLEMNYVIVLM